MPTSRPKPSAKNDTGEYARFTDFMRHLVRVPHSEIKAQLDAEREEKKRKRASRASSEKG